MAPLEMDASLSRPEAERPPYDGRRTTGTAEPDISRRDAEAAVRTLLRYIGEDPDREGLVETPERVVKSYDEFFSGYTQNPHDILARTFEETDGYDEMIVLSGIDFVSHCEHHMVAIVGTAYIGYLPRHRVVGVSKLARVLEAFAKRLQIQERLTAQVANAVEEVLQPRGVGVVLKSQHQCMTTRGVRQTGAHMVTSRTLGAFRDDRDIRQEFEAMAGFGRGGA